MDSWKRGMNARKQKTKITFEVQILKKYMVLKFFEILTQFMIDNLWLYKTGPIWEN